MDITLLGHASFRIRGKTATVITDPYDPTLVGMKFPKHVEADIVTVSHEHADHSSVREVEGNPFIIKGSGEYEVSGVGVVGLSAFHDDPKGTVLGRKKVSLLVRSYFENDAATSGNPHCGKKTTKHPLQYAFRGTHN